MFKKVRLRLTLLWGGISTLILVCMTLGYLYVSEQNLLQSKLISWQNDITLIASGLGEQQSLTAAWLAGLEKKENGLIAVFDNGSPFLYNRLSHTQEATASLETAWQYYQKNKLSFTEHPLSRQCLYRDFVVPGKESFHCFVIEVTKKEATLEMLLMLPLSGLRSSLVQQRILFLSIILPALLGLWTFAWFFTGKLLFPIEENRIRQRRFLADASHELRTPLAVILSCTEAILEKLHISSGANTGPALSFAPLAAELETVREEAIHMSSLLGDMLTLVSRDAGRLSLRKASVELDTLILDTCETYEHMARTKDIRLRPILPAQALPQCQCDKERIRQAVNILLHNAVSYTPAGGNIIVMLQYRREHGGQSRFALSVSDSGPGVPDAEKEKIFDRFYRSERSHHDKAHFGLGLAIAREIIEAHHGTIQVTDAPGGGAVFTVSLPADHF